MAATAQSNLPEELVRGLRIVVREPGTTTTIALEGKWDIAERRAPRQALRTALERRPECLVLDLSGLSFMDSTGVHGTIEAARWSSRLNVRLVIVPGPPTVQRIFEICQLTQTLPFTNGA